MMGCNCTPQLPLMPTFDKDAALAALAQRREENRSRKRVDNAALYAGSPMYFDCVGCGEEIVVPEDYVTRHKFCPKCQTLKANEAMPELPPPNERFWYKQ